ncbi:hypothetical protein CDAR_512191 [Caerostris darwini]|uniref:Ycf15 n=1 Tax=Caerostris darwini TaxID=1538125 RepID=A0AAV4WG18_9ARAC|nr:hypothetical protein CDAR_512191 [Caerostris darwini]
MCQKRLLSFEKERKIFGMEIFSNILFRPTPPPTTPYLSNQYFSNSDLQRDSDSQEKNPPKRNSGKLFRNSESELPRPVWAAFHFNKRSLPFH